MVSIEDLAQYKGTFVGLDVVTTKKIVNDDDECIHATVDRALHVHVLDGLYALEEKPQYIKSGELLVPLRYSLVKTLEFNRPLEMICKTVTAVRTGDRIHFTDGDFAEVFDGYKSNSIDIARYPILARFGCAYVPEFHAIKGETKNLLEGLRPIW
jgi:hypothetical protein